MVSVQASRNLAMPPWHTCTWFMVDLWGKQTGDTYSHETWKGFCPLSYFLSTFVIIIIDFSARLLFLEDRGHPCLSSHSFPRN